MGIPRVVQLGDPNQPSKRAVARVHSDGEHLEILKGFESLYEVVCEAARTRGRGDTEPQLVRIISENPISKTVSFDPLTEQGHILCPFTHPDPFRQFMTGTGLSHKGGVKARDSMHGGEGQSDSARMGQRGLEGGKPPAGQIGAEPEWFFKSCGYPVRPGGDLVKPPFGLSASEEPELALVFYVDKQGELWRIGTAIGNEFSDHVAERRNYLDLAGSKLRPCAIGPELLLGDEFPDDLQGTSTIFRGGSAAWKKPFRTGEANMIHSIVNLIHHHFKHAQWRQPDTVHIHFLGTDTVSSNDGFQTLDGDIFEIQIPTFGKPLRNILREVTEPDRLVEASAL